MTSKDHSPKVFNRRPKREFSLEDKKRLFNQWQASGLNKSQFCKHQDLVLSAFTKWCKKLSSDTYASPGQNEWIPVV